MSDDAEGKTGPDEKKEGIVTAPILAQLFDCDEKTIRNLAARGILVKSGHGKYVLTQSIRNYVRHLRETAAGRGGEKEQLTLAQERARFAREQAENIAIKNQVLRGTMVSVADVEKKWASMFSSIRAAFLSLSAQIAIDIPHLTRADISLIDRGIRDALESAANDIGADKTEM